MAIPPAIFVTDATSTNSSPSKSCGSGSWAASAVTPAAARVIALSANHGRAECPETPWNVHVALTLPRQPACSALSVGSIITTSSGASGWRASSGVSALSSNGSSSRPKNSAPNGSAVADELDHHRERALHVARAEPDRRAPRRAGRGGCPGPGRCRGGRRAAPARPPGRPARRCRRGRAHRAAAPARGPRARLVTRLRREVDQLERPGREALAEVGVARGHERAPYAHALLRHRRLGAPGQPAAVHAARAQGHRRRRARGDVLRARARSSRSRARSRASGAARRWSGSTRRRGGGWACSGPTRPRAARSACPTAATSACACATRCSTAAGCRSTRCRPPTRPRRSG